MTCRKVCRVAASQHTQPPPALTTSAAAAVLAPSCTSSKQWEPLVLAIGLCESYRVACGWASPTGEGFNSLKDDYEMGNLG